VPVDADRSEAREIEEAVREAAEQADVILLDTSAGGRFGGTGMAFPWHLAREAAKGTPVLVAGGINPDNVAAAMRESGAWGVDVSSGIEHSPGIKDPELMGRLFAEAGVKARGVPSGGGSSDRAAAADRQERQEGTDR
jgi:phosphoribosylanthranilate isomerase